MRTIVDMGSRIIKVIITEGDQVIGKNINTSEGIEHGLISSIERLSESIFETIMNAGYNLISNGEYTKEDILGNIYVTTSIKHCYITNESKYVKLSQNPGFELNATAGKDSAASKELKIDDSVTDSDEIQVWTEKYMIGGIYIKDLTNHLSFIDKPIKHHKIAINMNQDAQNIIRSIFSQFDANLKYISFNNCKHISNPQEVRIDVGYCGTRIFAHDDVQILPIGIYSLLKEISNTCRIPLRDAEKTLQISERNNTLPYSQKISKMCQLFIVNLFTQIINKQEKIDSNTYFILQGGINFIRIISDFIESKFGIHTYCYKPTLSYNNIKDINVNSYTNCIEMFTELDRLDVM